MGLYASMVFPVRLIDAYDVTGLRRDWIPLGLP